MSSVAIRVPETKYVAVKGLAATLDVPISQAAGILISEGMDSVRPQDYLSLDPDLKRERDQLAERLATEDDPDIGKLSEKRDELYEIQKERNRERSDFELSQEA